MTATCGYAVTDKDGYQQPCDRPATGWRWYQDVEHEDTLEAACDWHENEGGRRMHDAEAAILRVAELARWWSGNNSWQRAAAKAVRAALHGEG